MTDGVSVFSLFLGGVSQELHGEPKLDTPVNLVAGPPSQIDLAPADRLSTDSLPGRSSRGIKGLNPAVARI